MWMSFALWSSSSVHPRNFQTMMIRVTGVRTGSSSVHLKVVVVTCGSIFRSALNPLARWCNKLAIEHGDANRACAWVCVCRNANLRCARLLRAGGTRLVYVIQTDLGLV